MWGKIRIFAPTALNNVRMRFLGTIEAKTDAKGRAFLPSTFRKVLQSAGEERVVVRKDVFQPCLVLYPESVWNAQMDSLRRRLNRWNSSHQQLFRQFVAEAEVLTLDGNGRFLLSRRQRLQAALEQDIRFIGMGDTIELWAGGETEQPLMEAEEFGRALEQLMGGGDGMMAQNGGIMPQNGNMTARQDNRQTADDGNDE